MSDHAEGHDEKEHSGGHGGHGGGHGGHGGGHEEHEGVPEWMISFADNTALMMGLFVILLAMNMGPKATSIMGGEPDKNGANGISSAEDRMLDLALGIRAAFNNEVSIDSKDPREAALVRRKLEKLRGPLKQSGPPGTVETGQGPTQTDVSNVSTTVNFEDGSAQFNAVARDAVVDMATRSRDQRFIIEVRGHISPNERMRAGGDHGYKLAFDRAQAVANLMASNGVKWENIRIVACADNERAVARAYTDADQRKNQRVEIVITKQLVAGDPFSRESRSANTGASPTTEPSPAPAEK